MSPKLLFTFVLLCFYCYNVGESQRIIIIIGDLHISLGQRGPIHAAAHTDTHQTNLKRLRRQNRACWWVLCSTLNNKILARNEIEWERTCLISNCHCVIDRKRSGSFSLDEQHETKTNGNICWGKKLVLMVLISHHYLIHSVLSMCWTPIE